MNVEPPDWIIEVNVVVPELPDEPDEPDEPLPPDAPDKFTDQDEYIPLPYVLTTITVITPVEVLYESTVPVI